MTSRLTFGIGLAFAALAVAAGAFGAHGLAERLDARALELWETAARYLMYGGLALACLGAYGGRHAGRGPGIAPLLLALGTVVFSGTVALLALGLPRWLGAVTPFGGVLMIAGLALAAWRALLGPGASND